MENVNYVVCLSFLYIEGDTDVFYNNESDTIETSIYFAVMEDKTIVDQKYAIISNIKLQIIFPKHSVVRYHEYKLRYCYCTCNIHNGFSMEIFLVDMGKVFQSGGIKIVLIKPTFNQLNTHN